MDSIRWGIAGPGNIANKFAQAIQNVEGAVLTAVASRSLERGEAFADKYHIEHIFETYEEMASSDKMDAVYISTAHPFHKQCAEIFMKAGKHVLCEKPIFAMHPVRKKRPNYFKIIWQAGLCWMWGYMVCISVRCFWAAHLKKYVQQLM